MKFSVDKDPLIKAVTYCGKVVERRNTIPILANILIAADGDDTISIQATDLDVEVRAKVKAKVELPGLSTVPSAMLESFIKKLPESATVNIVTDTAQMKIQSGRSRINLNSLPAQDFPNFTSPTAGVTFKMKAADLVKMFETVQFAISTEETRFYLNGIHLHTSDGRNGPLLNAVATDGHRLGICTVPLPAGAANLIGMIVPRKTVGLVLTLLSDLRDQEIEFQASATRMQITAGNVILGSKLIDGTFPDYGRVIPIGNNIVATVPRQDFSDAVDRVATVSPENSRCIKLDFSSEQVTVSVINVDAGNAEEPVDLVCEGLDESNGLKIGFNSRYLQDILSRTRGENITVRLADPGAPCLLFDAANEDARFVLMPMRV